MKDPETRVKRTRDEVEATDESKITWLLDHHLNLIKQVPLIGMEERAVN